MQSIYESLCKLGLASDSTIELFHKGSRDNPLINFYRDKISGVIFIKDKYVGDDEYISGDYREIKAKKEGKTSSSINHERHSDYTRRISDNKQFYIGLDIVDFGCGHGHFLNEIKDLCKSVCGIELQRNLLESLNKKDIPCEDSINKLADNSIDSIFLFHTFEHLPRPMQSLAEMRKKLRDNGRIIIEVPHAEDFLISTLKSEAFIKSTLWSQHLILHTKTSMSVILENAGFKNIMVKGIQRYPLSNHLKWLKDKKGGGHLSNLSIIDDEELNRFYEKTLSKISKTDTLLIIADK